MLKSVKNIVVIGGAAAAGLLLVLWGGTPVSAAGLLTQNLAPGLKSSSAVRDLQQFLKEGGWYDGPITGNYLRLTQQAVKRFQIQAGIRPASGTVDLLTRLKINLRSLELALAAVGIEERRATRATPEAASYAEAAAKAESARRESEKTRQTTATTPASAINIQSVVAIRCYGWDPYEKQAVLGWKGTGVIINPKGYILTARHVADLSWAVTTANDQALLQKIKNGYRLDHCEVAVPAQNTVATVDEIRAVNPQQPVRIFGYTAAVVYLPTDLPVSDLESKNLDFAILKIDSLSDDSKYFKLPDYYPDKFPASRLWTGDLLPTDSEVLSFGYPGEPGLSAGSSFDQYFLKGSIEKVVKYFAGDSYFSREVMVTQLLAENAILGGRSGSPVFWQGQVIGLIVSTDRDLQRQSYAVNSQVIRKVLAGTGLPLGIIAAQP
ncbi:MAG: trypsin-like peptidase domain-containing protein [Candidatus Liptonbacteria bacterium]|nr:trypsin-like peptidase domain-containing protein [Candidatus Liptonbacteria bacterium]